MSSRDSEIARIAAQIDALVNDLAVLYDVLVEASGDPPSANHTKQPAQDAVGEEGQP